MDKKGHHSLQRPKGQHQINRHSEMLNEINRLLKEAEYNAQIEQKCKHDQNTQQMLKDNNIPGDVLAYRCDQENDYHFDAGFGNIFAAAYVTDTSKETRLLEKQSEADKILKCKHLPQFRPLATEVMGGKRDIFKFTLQNLADKIASINKMSYTVVINRTRKRLARF